MSETLMEAIYRYVEENRMPAALPRSRAAIQAVTDQERLEEMLEGEAARLFQQYLDHEAQAGLERDLALVRCGVSAGLELGRL